ncbi:zinc finger protein [Macleaya cordata]|uniref:Zinc finger protein n=1 Tax=Macleaya cordata TaxID=56857 RepID=A0A200Q8P3_MACCD|nr:zinc finger protein [Macleaya cordata]
MSIIDASNLRDLLRVRDDDDDGRNALAGLTLGAVLGCEEIISPNNNNPFLQQQPSRTLLDIIKDEESGAAYRGINAINNEINNNIKQQTSWKSFKDRLRLRRAGAVWSASSSSHHHPVSDCDFSSDGCRMDISNPTLTGIQRSSFSMVSSGSSVSTTVPVQNVTGFDERESSTIDHEEEINTSSSDVTVPNSSAPSGPVVMRLSAALAAEREEQRQASQLEDERESTETQLEVERENTVEVAEQQGDHRQQQNQSNNGNEELIDQRGVGVISTGQQQQQPLMALLEELGDHQRGVGVVSTGQQQQPLMALLEELGDHERGVGVISTGQQQQQQPLRVSLMALLEETMDHRQSEMILMDEEEEGEEDQVVMVERERGGGGGGGIRNEEYICCVCMVRHKGAAFIPCGHTFCRLCSRKLWVNRGNCPLCNGFILEILDIF